MPPNYFRVDDMTSRARRKLVSSHELDDWTNVKRTAIGPSYVDLSHYFRQSFGRRQFSRYVEYVSQKRLPKSGIGCRSLKDMALEVILQNMRGIDNVDDWPVFLVREIWEAVDKRCILNFHFWKVLSRALSKESDATLGMLHYKEIIYCPKHELQEYTKPLTSNSFDFIVCLSITVQFPVPNLVKLAKMANLGILEIINPKGEEDFVEGDGKFDVGDSLIRAWGREARQNRAFPVLRILRLHNHLNVTLESIRYIHDFPALGTFDLKRCGIEGALQAAEVIEALQLGWKGSYEDDISKAFEHEHSLISNHNATRAAPLQGLLWPMSRISRVDRHIAPESAIDPKTSDGFQNLASPNLYNDTYPPGDSSALQGSVDEWASISHDLFSNLSMLMSRKRGGTDPAWQSHNSICWALLGDVRQDSDLVRAGVKDMAKAARVGEHLISPVPEAHIRLGTNLDYNRRGVRSLTLIRLAVPTLATPLIDPQQGRKLKEQKNAERSTRQIRDSKRRKLQGILDSFHT